MLTVTVKKQLYSNCLYDTVAMSLMFLHPKLMKKVCTQDHLITSYLITITSISITVLVNTVTPYTKVPSF